MAERTPLRQGLPPPPARWNKLPIDRRGYPVPFFVDYVNGEPDHRIMAAYKVPMAIKRRLCWLCGQKLDDVVASVIGPMCAITRTIGEPPSHPECARYGAIACPHLTRPLAQRRPVDVPGATFQEGGLRRNPGAVCVWMSRGVRPFRAGRSILFDLGDELPVATEWYAQGRPALRSEVEASIDSGLHILEEDARKNDGESGLAELARRVAATRLLLSLQDWPG